MNKKLIKILIKPSLKRKSNNKPTKNVQIKTNKKPKKKQNNRKYASLRTNVESGYSATSFPFVFVQPYKQKNNKKKKSFRTTALVAPLI
jgi:hypothetical protein